MASGTAEVSNRANAFIQPDDGSMRATIVTTGEWSEYATANVRDAFLASLDEHDEARTIAIARHLVRCSNPLPSSTCAALGIAPGSSYGAGAQAYLVRAGAKW